MPLESVHQVPQGGLVLVESPTTIPEQVMPNAGFASENEKGTNPQPQVENDLSQDHRTRRQKLQGRVQYASLCLVLFLGGWNDGATGALLPRIQSVYDVNFTILSLIFVFACLGFMTGSVASMFLTDWLGFGKTLAVGSILQIIAYSIQSPGPVYPVYVLGYFIGGAGFAIQDAQANGYVANVKHRGATKMGAMHAIYGLGLFAAPLVSTQFAQIPRWSFHFLVSLGIAILNSTAQIVVFRLQSLDKSLVLAGEEVPEKAERHEGSLFKQVMTCKEAHILAIFIVAHLGVIVTVGGWIVTYVIDIRHGNLSSGYISAGVSAGVMVGRLVLIPVNHLVGDRLVLFIYAGICIGLELIVWFVPSLVGNAIAVAFIGFFMGPMYPIAVNQAKRILPGRMLTGVIGWMAGFGQTGSALVPFMTGAIASKHGLKTMPPLIVGMTVVMIVMWILVPTKPRTRE